jgi:hypothetical protein
VVDIAARALRAGSDERMFVCFFVCPKLERRYAAAFGTDVLPAAANLSFRCFKTDQTNIPASYAG